MPQYQELYEQKIINQISMNLIRFHGHFNLTNLKELRLDINFKTNIEEVNSFEYFIAMVYSLLHLDALDT